MVFKITHQCWENGGGFIQQAGYVVIHENAAVDHAVQHVFYRPGQLTYHHRTNHATAALQGMKCSTHFRKSTAIIMLAQEHGQVFADSIQNLAGFLDEDFQDFIVNQIVLLVIADRRFELRDFLVRRLFRTRHSRNGWLDVAVAAASCRHGLCALGQPGHITRYLTITEFLNQ